MAKKTILSTAVHADLGEKARKAATRDGLQMSDYLSSVLEAHLAGQLGPNGVKNAADGLPAELGVYYPASLTPEEYVAAVFKDRRDAMNVLVALPRVQQHIIFIVSALSFMQTLYDTKAQDAGAGAAGHHHPFSYYADRIRDIYDPVVEGWSNSQISELVDLVYAASRKAQARGSSSSLMRFQGAA